MTGFAVLLGITKVQHPGQNFKNPFGGTVLSVNGFATGEMLSDTFGCDLGAYTHTVTFTAIIKIDYTFAGWNHAVIFLSEVQSEQHTTPGRTNPASKDTVSIVRRASFVALGMASVIFLFLNLSYFAAVPKKVLADSGSLVGAMFCEAVYGKDSFVAVRLFPIFVALSCVGGLIATVSTDCQVSTDCSDFLSRHLVKQGSPGKQLDREFYRPLSSLALHGPSGRPPRQFFFNGS